MNSREDSMQHIIDFITNPCLIVPLVTWFIAQLIKVIITAIVNKEFRVERLWGDGGMPSGHSATVCSLATMCGLSCGFGTPYFALACVYAVVVMHDATGVRREAGKQAVTLKKLALIVNDAVSDPDKRIRTEKLKVLVGHTPLQVFIGAMIGILVALCYYWIFGVSAAV